MTTPYAKKVREGSARDPWDCGIFVCNSFQPDRMPSELGKYEKIETLLYCSMGNGHSIRLGRWMKELRKLGLILVTTLLLGLVLLPLLQYEIIGSRQVNLTNGILNVKELDFEQGLYELKGKIEVYPNYFLAPGSQERFPFELREIPHPWEAKSGVTHGSYRFLLEGLNPGSLYGFYLLDSLTAHEVFADGHSIARMGIPAETPDQTIPAVKIQSAFFQAAGSRSEIIIHVSSHSSHLIGFWQKTLFGPMAQIQSYEVRAKVADAFTVGAVLFLTIYVWIIFLIMRTDKVILYFALACSCVTVKTLLSGQQLLMNLQPGLPYEIGLRVAYLMVPAIAVTFVAFAGEYFQKTAWPAFQRIVRIVSAIQAVLLVVLPQRWYQQTFLGYQAFLLLIVILVLGWAVKAFRIGLEGAGVYVAGFVLFFIIGLNDTLYSMLVIRTGYYLGFGLLVLMLSQATILAMRVRQALRMEADMKQNLEQQVLERTRELETEKQRFENLSKVDSLTRLSNKGSLMEILRSEMEGYIHYHRPFSIIMADLDHFKTVNDSYGHVCGDIVLQTVADTLTEHSRRTDVIGRFGGEEFLLILRFTAKNDANRHAQHLREKIEALQFEWDGALFKITASFGVSSAKPGLSDEQVLIRQADEAMYEAKKRGRNRVVAH